ITASSPASEPDGAAPIGAWWLAHPVIAGTVRLARPASAILREIITRIFSKDRRDSKSSDMRAPLSECITRAVIARRLPRAEAQPSPTRNNAGARGGIAHDDAAAAKLDDPCLAPGGKLAAHELT